MKLHESGVIKGGVCDKRHKNRLDRYAGCIACWEFLKETGHVVENDDGWKLIKEPTIGWREVQRLSGGGEADIAWLRVFQVLLPAIGNKAFKEETMITWLDSLSAMEFSLSPKAVLAILKGEDGLVKPHDDGLFRKRLATGELQL